MTGNHYTVTPSEFLAATKVVGGVGQWLLHAMREADDMVHLAGYLAYTADSIDALEKRSHAPARKRILGREAIAWRRAARFVSSFCYGPFGNSEKIGALVAAFESHPVHRTIPIVVDRCGPRDFEDYYEDMGRQAMRVRPIREMAADKMFSAIAARSVCKALGTWVLYAIRDAANIEELAGFFRYTAHEIGASGGGNGMAWRRAAALALLSYRADADVDGVAQDLAQEGLPYVVSGCGHRSLRQTDKPPRRAGRPRESKRPRAKRVAKSA